MDRPVGPRWWKSPPSQHPHLWRRRRGPCKNDQYTAAVHAWFDKWLMGRSVNTGPNVEIFLNNGKVMTSPTWPPRTEKVKLFPVDEGKLATKLQEQDGSANYVSDKRGQVQELGTGGVEFTPIPSRRTRRSSASRRCSSWHRSSEHPGAHQRDALRLGRRRADAASDAPGGRSTPSSEPVGRTRSRSSPPSR